MLLDCFSQVERWCPEWVYLQAWTDQIRSKPKGRRGNSIYCQSLNPAIYTCKVYKQLFNFNERQIYNVKEVQILQMEWLGAK